MKQSSSTDNITHKYIAMVLKWEQTVINNSSPPCCNECQLNKFNNILSDCIVKSKHTAIIHNFKTILVRFNSIIIVITNQYCFYSILLDVHTFVFMCAGIHRCDKVKYGSIS